MASGSRSLGGTCTVENLLDEAPCTVGIVPVTSPAGAGAGVGCACGGVARRAPSSALRAGLVVRFPAAGGRRRSRGAARGRVLGVGPLSARTGRGVGRAVADFN